jgi:hypothetical protein
MFECKVKYTKVDSESGKEKKLTETYLVDAVDFIEAQTRIHKEMESLTSGEFELQSIKRVKYAELVQVDCENIIWYKAKVSFTAVDETSGKEKRTAFSVLVTGSNVEEASQNIQNAFKDSMSDYTIEGITDSKIIDYLPYEQAS